MNLVSSSGSDLVEDDDDDDGNDRRHVPRDPSRSEGKTIDRGEIGSRDYMPSFASRVLYTSHVSVLLCTIRSRVSGGHCGGHIHGDLYGTNSLFKSKTSIETRKFFIYSYV